MTKPNEDSSTWRRSEEVEEWYSLSSPSRSRRGSSWPAGRSTAAALWWWSAKAQTHMWMMTSGIPLQTPLLPLFSNSNSKPVPLFKLAHPNGQIALLPIYNYMNIFQWILFICVLFCFWYGTAVCKVTLSVVKGALTTDMCYFCWYRGTDVCIIVQNEIR